MSPDISGRLGFINLSGKPYEIGAALGRFGSEIVHRHLTSSRSWNEVLQRRSDPRISLMADVVRTGFPRYWAELQGLASGLQLPFEDVFAWNCRGDIGASSPDGCTTVQIPGDTHLVAHNEDGDPGFTGHCALAHVESEGGLPFTAFVYPASLPGHAFSVNAAGLVQTVNNIRCLEGGVGAPRMVLTRAVMDSKGLDEALTVIRRNVRAGAYHLTLAQAGDERLLSVEFTPSGISMRRLQAPAVHANHLIHDDAMPVSQIVTGSSCSRQRRGEELLRGLASKISDEDCLGILWDKQEMQLPIHRAVPDDPDNENTLATAVFRVPADKVECSVYDRPHRLSRFLLVDGLKSAKA